MSKIYNSLSSMIMEATKGHDQKKAQAYKNLKAKMIEWKTSKEGAKVVSENSGEIPDSQEIVIIQKMVAELRNDIISYSTRKDLIEEATAELSYIEPLLPEEPTESDVKECISGWIQKESRYPEKKDMGALVKYIKECLPGVSGKMASDLVRSHLV